MFEKFTDDARKVMALANQEALRLNHEYIGTEHVLLGLLRQGAGVAHAVLRNLQLAPDQVQEAVERHIAPVARQVFRTGKLPQTPRAKRVIEYAIEEGRLLGHQYVGTEHLLLGLLRETEGIAAQVLTDLGVSLAAAREEVLTLLGAGSQGDAAPAAGPSAPPRVNGRPVMLDESVVHLLSAALRVAQADGAAAAGPQHLLLAILRDADTSAAQGLARLGVTEASLRQALGGA